MAVNRSRKARFARRRKKRMARVEHDLTAEQWIALTEAWGGCAYCGATDKPLQRDCVLAISRGGRYTLSNIVPACGSCNASKCNEEVTGWLRRKRLDERAFLLRHIEITAELGQGYPSGASAEPEFPEPNVCDLEAPDLNAPDLEAPETKAPEPEFCTAELPEPVGSTLAIDLGRRE